MTEFQVRGMPSTSGEGSYIASHKEVITALEKLKHCPGLEILQKELRSSDWELCEHGIATVTEASLLVDKVDYLELCPCVTVEGREKRPDFTITKGGEKVYFEVKTSSMFPREKSFLKIQPDLTKALESVHSVLQYILRIDTGEFQSRHIPFIQAEISSYLQSLKYIEGFPTCHSIGIENEELARLIVLGKAYHGFLRIEAEVGKPQFERAIIVEATQPRTADKGSYWLGYLCGLFDTSLLLMLGTKPDDYLDKCAHYLFDLSEQPWIEDETLSHFLIDLLMKMPEYDYYLIAASPPYTARRRMRYKIEQALSQLPNGEKSILVLHSREVIMDMPHIGEALVELVSHSAYEKLAAIVAQVRLASGHIQRVMFINAHAKNPLSRDVQTQIAMLCQDIVEIP